MKRTLMLRREALAGLSPDELEGVLGAAEYAEVSRQGNLNYCISKIISCFYC